MTKTILITGGAGFIGSHIADDLLRYGYRVRVLDNLSSATHGAGSRRPACLDSDIELIVGDIQDSETVKRALKGVSGVCHLACAVGAGQSMYDIRTFTGVNNLGTAVLIDALVEHRVERLVVASDMVIYGEGLYKSPDGTFVQVAERSSEQLRCSQWDLATVSGEPLTPVATPEWKTPALASVYALSKFGQERMCQLAGELYGIPTVVLRLFNVYGLRQLLLNPYIGVVSIFASKLAHHTAPTLYEDGKQLRDFSSVKDVARAFRLALTASDAPGRVINIASGRPTPVSDVMNMLASAMGRGDIRPRVTGRHRTFDVRHCFADVTVARQVLGFEPSLTLAEGLAEIAAGVQRQMPYDRPPAFHAAS